VPKLSSRTSSSEARASSIELGGADLAATVVRKLGSGAVADGQAYAARPGSVADTSGAGDALAAGFLLGGIELGLDAAARCVAKLGTMP